MRSVGLSILIGCSCVAAIQAEPSPVGNWPNWRGPTFNGVAEKGSYPVEWDQKKNVKWKIFTEYFCPGESKNSFGANAPAQKSSFFISRFSIDHGNHNHNAMETTMQ